MRQHEQGFTLIEVLVAVAVFSIGLVLLSNLMGTIRLNGKNMQTLTASQAVQDALERTARAFQTGTYGKLTSAQAPLDLAGYTWTVDVCVASTTDNTCTNTSTLTKTSYAAVYTAPVSANLLRVKVSYTPVSTSQAAPASATLEIAKS